jgi:exonuclease SbcC
MKTIVSQNQEAAKHNSRIAVFKEQSEKFLEDLTKQQEQLRDETKVLTNLELLKKALSTNGLIAYKIENLVKDLEELTNEYLAELSDGRFTIEFTVSSDKLNVVITDNGNTVDILALSSGELARVNTATLLALRKLMNSISKSRINVLFLDEVIGVLDDAGKEKLVEVLLEEDLNTFIVSHSWTHPLLSKLEVIKEDDMSRIERQ